MRYRRQSVQNWHYPPYSIMQYSMYTYIFAIGVTQCSPVLIKSPPQPQCRQISSSIYSCSRLLNMSGYSSVMQYYPTGLSPLFCSLGNGCVFFPLHPVSQTVAHQANQPGNYKRNKGYQLRRFCQQALSGGSVRRFSPVLCSIRRFCAVQLLQLYIWFQGLCHNSQVSLLRSHFCCGGGEIE